MSAADVEGAPQRRQVYDLPAPVPAVTEHQTWGCRCQRCGQLMRAVFPEGVTAPVQYGPRMAATAVYLQNAHFLPEDRLAEIFRDVFGVALCAATLAGMSRQRGGVLAGLRGILVHDHWASYCKGGSAARDV